MAAFILIISFICLKVANSQYYSLPPSPYPYYYTPQPPAPFQPPYAPPFSSPGQYPVPYSQSLFAPFPVPYNLSPQPLPPIPSYTLMSNYVPTGPQTKLLNGHPTTLPSEMLNHLYKSKSAPKLTKQNPSSAIYYVTSEMPTAAELVKENIPVTPEYNCPICNGFADVPSSSKIAPPPSVSTVLPALLDKIPAITKQNELKLKDLKDLCKKPLSELLEHKLSGKIRFDEDVLDGFLTGLGLGKNK